MLSLNVRTRIFISIESISMKNSYSGLISKTKQIIGEDPLSGYMFVFFNKRRDYVKALYWDESGYCIWSKRLEVGTFEIPKADNESCKKVAIDRKKLMLILEGISLKNIKERKRFCLKK